MVKDLSPSFTCVLILIHLLIKNNFDQKHHYVFSHKSSTELIKVNCFDRINCPMESWYCDSPKQQLGIA